MKRSRLPQGGLSDGLRLRAELAQVALTPRRMETALPLAQLLAEQAGRLNTSHVRQSEPAIGFPPADP